jgi:DNA repair protein RadC
MTGKPHHLGHRQRLKDRFLRESRGLADYELLELLLGYGLPRKDTKPLAKSLLDRFGSLRGLLTAKPHELREVDGFGAGLEVFWKVWREFWARAHEDGLRSRESLHSPQEVVELARARIGFEARESFWTVLVDNKNRVLGFQQIGQGTVDQAPVYPREILAAALERQASGLILVHNHPGGDPEPSSQDVDFTRRIHALGQELGIRVLDHIIVAEDADYSFQQAGLL